MTELLWIVLITLAVIGVVQAGPTLLFARRIGSYRIPPIGNEQCPRAAVVLCLRGHDPFLDACLEGLLRQDYPFYHVWIVIDQPDDPAWAISQQAVRRLQAANVTIEPLEERLATCSLKGSSLAQAVSRIDESFAVVAFLDGDTIPHRTWLRELAAPLQTPGVGVSSGNRWYVPQDARWGTLVRYVWNAAAVVQMYWNHFTWGGSVALRGEIARHPELSNRWRAAISTDTVIHRIVRSEGLRTAFVPSLLIMNREGCRLSDFYVWVQRQLAVGRLYHKGWPVVLSHGVLATLAPLGALAAVTAGIVQGRWGLAFAALAGGVAYWFLMAGLFIVLERSVRGSVRARGETPDTWSAMTAVRLFFALPLTQAVYAAALCKATFLRTFRWRGVVYRVDGPWQVRLVEYHPYRDLASPQASATAAVVESVADGPRPARKRGARPRVLLTEGSSVASRVALYLLGRDYSVDILDPSRFCQSRFSRFVRRWHRCPHFSKDPAGYLTFLSDLLRKERYDVLLPTHEQVYLVARCAPQLGHWTGLAVPEFAAVERLQSKAEFVRLMDEVGLPYPATRIVRTRPEIEATSDFPCYIKVAYSTAGTGVRRVDNSDQLRRFAAELAARNVFNGETEILVQQPAQGVQAAITTVFQRGTLVAAHCAEATALGVGGSAMMQVSAWHPEVVEQVRRLGQHLRWHGGLFLDYYYDPASGQPQYIEANPRVGPSVNGWLSGVNVVDALIRVALGEEIEPVYTRQLGVRTHQAFLVLMARALEGAGRRQLAAECWRHWTASAGYRHSRDEVTRLADDWLSLFPYLGVTLLLLLRPAAAHGVVRRTVDNYSLSEAGARQIARLSGDLP